jgi:hypothetical protein
MARGWSGRHPAPVIVAKFWVDPVRLVASGGFRRPELRDIERIVIDNERALLEAWHGFFPG